MKYSDMRPDKTRGRKPSPAAEAKPKADPGPRPLSARQRAFQGAGGDSNTPAAAAGSALPPETRAAVSAARRLSRSEIRHARRVNLPPEVIARRRNRLRRNVPRLLLRIALFVFIGECAAALLFSPRLWVRTVTIEGNTTLPTEQVWKRIAIAPRTNIVTLPTWNLEKAVLREPVVETVEIRRSLPPEIILRVRERQPWASVQAADGVFYTIDRHFIAFRQGSRPEEGLPLFSLTVGADEAAERKPVTLGKKMQTVGLKEAGKCLAWARKRGDFPVAKITIDPKGKLCLNRVGGVRILLGSGMDLDRKLDTLGLLLERVPELRDGDAGKVDYVNLFAYDAPAILPRSDAVAAPLSPSSTSSDLPTVAMPAAPNKRGEQP